MRIALVTEIPAPFRIPLWNALAAADGVDLHVLFLSEDDPRRNYDVHPGEWRFEGSILRGWHAGARGRWLVVNRGLRRELERSSPDVVMIGGWNQPAFFRATRHARTHGKPLVVWVESTLRDERSHGQMRERLKRWLVRSAAAFVVPGQAAAEYVRSFGVEPGLITVAPNAFDVKAFSRRVDDDRRRRNELRRELDLYGCCFLCVSRLSREKGVDVLVRAFAGVPGQLVVIGDGQQREEVQRLAGPTVRFVGHVPADELPRWYAAADAFALASRSETWGMALSEAAAAGLPLVVSEAAGAAYDLVEEGVNGFRVAVEDEAGLRAALRRVAEDETFRARAGIRSRDLAERHTPERWAEAVAGLARELVSPPRR